MKILCVSLVIFKKAISTIILNPRSMRNMCMKSMPISKGIEHATVSTSYHKDRREFVPIIYRIARDYLAIPAMSTPSEALFSRATDIITKKRNRLHPSTIKMLAILMSRAIVTDESEISDMTNVAEKVGFGEEITGREINDASDDDVATEDDEMTL